MALCISGIVLGMTGLRSMACVRSQRKHKYVLADARVITPLCRHVKVGLPARATRSFYRVGTERYRRLRLRHMT